MFAEDELARMRQVAAGDGDRLAAMVDRRCGGEPLPHVVGLVELLDRDYVVEPGVFVPRPRSELLVRVSVEHLDAIGGDVIVVDLCCGSGALGACIHDLAAAVTSLELHASDIEPRASACARRNVLPRGGSVWTGELDDALPQSLRGRVDVLVANVPYVASADLDTLPSDVRCHEARIAHDGGADGLELLRRVAAIAPAWLTPGGIVVLEVARHQLPAALDALDANGLRSRHVADDELDALAVVGRRLS